MLRPVTVVLSLALAVAACSSDGGDESVAVATSAPTTVVPTTTPPTTAASTTTAAPPTVTTATTAPTTSTAPTTTPVTAAGPVTLPDLTTIVEQTELGAGFVLDGVPGAASVWMIAPPDGPEVLGCEGVPAGALWAQPTAGDDRTAALPDQPDLLGISRTVTTADGRAVLVRACEGFFTDAWIGTADPSGTVADVDPLVLPTTTLFTTIRLTPDGVTYVDREPFGSIEGTLVSLDGTTGDSRELLTGDVWDGVVLATGSLVYRTGTELFVDGFSLGTFPETGAFGITFEPGPRGGNVAVGVGGRLAVYVGADDELVTVLDDEVAVLDWHPSGEALLVNGPFDPEQPTPPQIVLLDGTTIPLPVGGDVVDAAFSGDGLTVAVSAVAESGEVTTTAFTFAA